MTVTVCTLLTYLLTYHSMRNTSSVSWPYGVKCDLNQAFSFVRFSLAYSSSFQ